MKRQFIFEAITLVLLSATSSCSDNDLLDSTTSQGLYKVTVNISSSIGTIDGTSRATLGGDNGLTPVWQDNDKIGVLTDNVSEASVLSLYDGAETSHGTFRGTITTSAPPVSMYFYYPSSAAGDTGVDLTTQDGTGTKEMVMFATCDYDENPSLTFTNKTSILKFNMDLPSGADWTADTKLTATIYGAYSKGILKTDGTWSDLKTENITVSDIMVNDNKVTGYAVVIPGSNVTNLRIAITDGTNNYTTDPYTNAGAVIPVNKVITINKPLTRSLALKPGTTTADNISEHIKTEGTNLTIIVADQMTENDFKALTSAIKDKDKGSINLTLLNQKSVMSLGENYALKSLSAPNATDVEESALEYCEELTSVYLPNVRIVGIYAFEYCTSLTTLELPEATTVSAFAFYNCTALTTLSLPSATTVANNAFARCTTTGITLTAKAGEAWWQSKEWKNVIQIP